MACPCCSISLRYGGGERAGTWELACPALVAFLAVRICVSHDLVGRSQCDNHSDGRCDCPGPLSSPCVLDFHRDTRDPGSVSGRSAMSVIGGETYRIPSVTGRNRHRSPVLVLGANCHALLRTELAPVMSGVGLACRRSGQLLNLGSST